MDFVALPIQSIRRPSLAITAALALVLLAAAPVAAEPIPEDPTTGGLPSFIGSRARPMPVYAPQPPQHPFMAPNGRSNIHDDAYQSDTYQGAGPLGRGMETVSTFQGAECASITFDSLGRIVSVCVGVQGPTLTMLDPQTLDLLTTMPLPPRAGGGGGGNPFTDFSGGGYFYLDNLDRAVIPTTTRHIWIVGETDGPAGPAFQLEQDFDLSLQVLPGDGIISALPDWSGRIWFISGKGIVGTVDPSSGTVKTLNLAEPIGNSFAVDETGGVYIVSNRALYRFQAAPDGTPTIAWSAMYDNIGVVKPGQTEAGSGTTPTLMGSQYVSITDNDDPMKVMVYKRAANVTGSRVVCAVPVFKRGASSTDQSLIGTDRSIVVENNFGYTGPTSVMNGVTTTPGFERVDINSDGSGCRTIWRNSKESAPSVVPKLSLRDGLVYTYTKPARDDQIDTWYLTAISFRTGKTIYKKLAGTGLGFNNNFAPVSIGPDATSYVGALGGLVLFRDR
jgi:hypothetical protein